MSIGRESIISKFIEEPIIPERWGCSMTYYA